MTKKIIVLSQLLVTWESIFKVSCICLHLSSELFPSFRLYKAKWSGIKDFFFFNAWGRRYMSRDAFPSELCSYNQILLCYTWCWAGWKSQEYCSFCKTASFWTNSTFTWSCLKETLFLRLPPRVSQGVLVLWLLSCYLLLSERRGILRFVLMCSFIVSA